MKESDVRWMRRDLTGSPTKKLPASIMMIPAVKGSDQRCTNCRFFKGDECALVAVPKDFARLVCDLFQYKFPGEIYRTNE